MKYFFALMLTCSSVCACGQSRVTAFKRAESLIKNSPEYKKIEEVVDTEHFEMRLVRAPSDDEARSDTMKFWILTSIQGLPCAGHNHEYSIYYSIRRNKIISITKEEQQND